MPEFKQNLPRNEELEVEERAMMSLQAMDYDNLKLLSLLPQHSELYQLKMDQYKEISKVWLEIEKVLQEQRLEKIWWDFEL